MPSITTISPVRNWLSCSNKRKEGISTLRVHIIWYSHERAMAIKFATKLKNSPPNDRDVSEVKQNGVWWKFWNPPQRSCWCRLLWMQIRNFVENYGRSSKYRGVPQPLCWQARRRKKHDPHKLYQGLFDELGTPLWIPPAHYIVTVAASTQICKIVSRDGAMSMILTNLNGWSTSGEGCWTSTLITIRDEDMAHHKHTRTETAPTSFPAHRKKWHT